MTNLEIDAYFQTFEHNQENNLKNSLNLITPNINNKSNPIKELKIMLFIDHVANKFHLYLV